MKERKPKIKKCKRESCKKEFEVKNFCQKYCSALCMSMDKPVKKKKTILPISAKRLDELKVYAKNKRELINEQKEKYGFNFCERCGQPTNRIEIHHIIYRSEAPYNPEIHNKLNLLIVDRKCHEFYHSDKSNRDSLVEERKLKELFE